ncbi:MAG: hypothetical protein CM1200mP30_25620 [Pseudomonadota bacterium]|nr:MAG: hypothetical protein CM1200mP30_25620 [Pseudomonadota bacterium]
MGHRIRVIWSGAEYRGRGRQSSWTGRAVFKECTLKDWPRLILEPEGRLEKCSKDTVEWDAITTGNFGGFDVWLDEADDAELNLPVTR